MLAAVITVSSSRAAGSSAPDESGPRLQALARLLGAETVESELVPDSRTTLEERIVHWCDVRCCALVLTSGGTGVAPDDVTPEATQAVLDREIPGIAEAMRLVSREHTVHWMLSRATAGVRGGTLIVNLPGSPRAVEEVADALAPALGHALALIGGGRASHDGG
jgi:molybdopterin adenylyltransferase